MISDIHRMNKNTTLLIVLILFTLSSCSDKKDAVLAGIEGYDLSGTYTLSDRYCNDVNGFEVITITPGITEKVVIDKNKITHTVENINCKATISGRIVVNSNNGTSGVFSVSNQTTSTITAGTCIFSIAQSSGSSGFRNIVYPGGNTFSIFHNDSHDNYETDFTIEQSSKKLIMPSDLIASSLATDVCLDEYTHQ